MSNKYVILNAENNSVNGLLNKQSDWFMKIAEFISNQIVQKTISMIEINPQKSSYIYELDRNPKKIMANGKTLLYTSCNSVPYANIKTLIETQDFYLGNSFIVLGLLDERKLKDLSNFWYKNPAESELEIFSMGNDGNSFYWYNPVGFNSEQEFNSFFG